VTERIFNVSLEQISPDSNQPRKHFDRQKLNELAESIKEYGLLQPITVMRNNNGGFTIVQGERRYRACKIAGLPSIRCIVADIEDSKLGSVRVVENVEREDLSDLELAREFQKRVDQGETHQQIADSIKKTRAYVTQRLALLKLPENIQRKLEKGEIGFTEARILALSGINRNEESEHGYAVTIEELEVYKLFHSGQKPELDQLYLAYRKDLATLRRAKQ